MERAQDDGWDESADAWIADMGEAGDYTRRRVLDAPMLARVARHPYRDAVDIGCGEGRFCRMLRARGLGAIGVEPTQALREAAQQRDPTGDYRDGVAERLPLDDTSVDLAVAYLVLIDIPDFHMAIAEMTRVVRPGGRILIANLSSHWTSAGRSGWRDSMVRRFGGLPIKDYAAERAVWLAWRGIRIRNWHRPLSAYVRAFLAEGLVLRHFDEPLIPDPRDAEDFRYNNAPWVIVMEWEKP
jgi:SAM-dependent methyltransferase